MLQTLFSHGPSSNGYSHTGPDNIDALAVASHRREPRVGVLRDLLVKRPHRALALLLEGHPLVLRGQSAQGAGELVAAGVGGGGVGGVQEGLGVAVREAAGKVEVLPGRVGLDAHEGGGRNEPRNLLLVLVDVLAVVGVGRGGCG